MKKKYYKLNYNKMVLVIMGRRWEGIWVCYVDDFEVLDVNIVEYCVLLEFVNVCVKWW